MKKVLVLFLVFVLMGCGAKTDDKKTKDKAACGDENASSCKIEDSADMSEYENFTDDNNQFTKSDMTSILSMIENNESGIVYFGFPKCPWCVEALPIMDEVAKAQNVEILYVQTRDNDKKQLITDEEKASIMEYTDAYLDSDDDGKKAFFVPFVIVVKEGKVVAGHIGTVDGYDTEERKMNDNEKQQLRDIYTTMFEK